MSTFSALPCFLRRGRGGLVEGVPARVDLAVGEQVRLPVIELQASGGADLGLGALGVLHRWQADGDLLAARALDLRLGHAEGVDALAHRLDRVVDRLLGDLGDLRGRARLVDELDAALEVEAELGVLGERSAGQDHQQREHEQCRDGAEDRQIADAVAHSRGVSTRSSPPSSS